MIYHVQWIGGVHSTRSYLLIRQLTSCGPLLYKEHDLFIFTTQVINLSMSNKVVLF